MQLTFFFFEKTMTMFLIFLFLSLRGSTSFVRGGDLSRFPAQYTALQKLIQALGKSRYSDSNRSQRISTAIAAGCNANVCSPMPTINVTCNEVAIKCSANGVDSMCVLEAKHKQRSMGFFFS